MLQFIRESGPVIFPLFGITLLILALCVWKTIELCLKEPNPRSVEWGLNAILFWGGFSAVLGILGQFTGIYKGLNALVHAEMVNPRFVFMGLKESMNTALYGLTVLLLAGLAWFVLNTWYNIRRPLK